MLISNAFPSNYIRAADLQGRSVVVTIDRVTLEDLNGEHKPVLHFEGKHRGLVLNKTNATTLAGSFGDDTAAWEGQKIELFPVEADFQGRRVPAIRVRVPPGTSRADYAAPVAGPNAYAEAS